MSGKGRGSFGGEVEGGVPPGELALLGDESAGKGRAVETRANFGTTASRGCFRLAPGPSRASCLWVMCTATRASASSKTPSFCQ